MKFNFFGLDPKKIKILVFCCLLGFIFLLVSEYSVTNQNQEEQPFSEEAYTRELETRLSDMIGTMKGVSEVKVMVTLAGSRQNRYAMQNSTNHSSVQSSTETFLQMQEESGGKSSPILTQTLLPEIKGVSVVCRGADNDTVRIKILELIASTLNININQIYVTE
jgi:stage III sporulation protein AG